MKPKQITITELAKQFPPDGQMGKRGGLPVVGPIPMRFWFKHEKSIREAIRRAKRKLKVWYMHPSNARDNYVHRNPSGNSRRAALKYEAGHASIYIDQSA